MQDPLSLWLSLLLAHLAGDFVFQTQRMVEGRKAGSTTSFLGHGAVLLALCYMCLLVFTPEHLSMRRIHVAVVALVATRILFDWIKERKRTPAVMSPPAVFIADQVLHVAVITLVVVGVDSEPQVLLGGWWERLSQVRIQVLSILLIYLGTVFGGGYLIRLLLSRRDLISESESGQKRVGENERRAGMYIGWLERFVIVTAILAKSPTAVGLIVAAKSIVRFKKVESSDEFAEYFLLGSFLSLALALCGGLVLRWALFGSIDLE